MNTVESLAQSLGVSAASLQALGATRNDSAWTFPERDAEGRIIGTARRLDDGRKLMVTGSKRGLTMAWPLDSYAGSSVEEPILIVEGASDTAAGMDLGFVTIGRPSATGGLKYLRPLLRDRHVVIVGENDDAGRRGAEKIAPGLVESAASVRILYPPACAKDLREWYTAPVGCDREELLSLIRKCEPIEVARAEAIKPERPAPAIEPFVPFPLDSLPEPFRSFVRDAAKAIGCDPSYIVLPLLAAAASAIGNTRRVQLKRGWTEPAILWMAIVGDSGTLKSPALELALRAVRDRQDRAMRDYAEAVEQYAADRLRYEADESAWKSKRKSKGDAAGDPPVKPEPPIADRCWTDDATTEALAVLLVNQWRGLLMVRDELAGWIGGFDRYAAGKGADVARWLEMFGGRPMVVDRKTSGTIYVPAAAVSIAGGIQPETLRRALGIEHRENGLAARLLLACPPRRVKRWTEAEIDPCAEAAIADVLDALYTLEPAHDDYGGPRPVIVPLTPDGKAAWVEFYNAHADEQADLAGDLSAAWSKLEGYAARLALVVHFVRWAAGDPTLRTVDAVDGSSIATGVALSRWFGHEVRRVYGILAESDDARERRRLVEWIERRGSSVTVRELTHGLRQYRNATDAARSALDDLAAAGFGRWEHPAPGPTGGRPSPRFHLVASVTVTETPKDDPTSDGIGDGDDGDAEEWGEL